MHLFASLVLIFGVVYYLIGVQPQDKRFVIKMGIYGKACVVLVCAIDAYLGLVTWPINIAAAGDAIFAYLFYRSLKSAVIN